MDVGGRGALRRAVSSGVRRVVWRAVMVDECGLCALVESKGTYRRKVGGGGRIGGLGLFVRFRVGAILEGTFRGRS